MDIRENSEIFARIGGASTVRAVVDAFYQRVLNDPALAPAFAGIEMQQLRRHQMQFLAAALGGPAAYRGRNMREAHRGLGVTTAQFAGVAAHLHEALRDYVSADEIEAILATVAALQTDIVES